MESFWDNFNAELDPWTEDIQETSSFVHSSEQFHHRWVATKSYLNMNASAVRDFLKPSEVGLSELSKVMQKGLEESLSQLVDIMRASQEQLFSSFRAYKDRSSEEELRAALSEPEKRHDPMHQADDDAQNEQIDRRESADAYPEPSDARGGPAFPEGESADAAFPGFSFQTDDLTVRLVME